MATQVFAGGGGGGGGGVCLDLEEVTLYEGKLATYARDGNTEIEVGNVKLTSSMLRCEQSKPYEKLEISVVLDEQIEEYDVDFTKSILEVHTYTSFDLSVNQFFLLGRTEFSFGDTLTIRPDFQDQSDHSMQVVREKKNHLWNNRSISEEISYAGLTPKAIAEGKRPLACSITSLYLNLRMNVPQKENMNIFPLNSIRDFQVPEFCD
jgi:hypothetical protein